MRAGWTSEDAWGPGEGSQEMQEEDDEDDEDDKVIKMAEQILDRRADGLFLVKWQGYPIEKATWKPAADLSAALVDEWHRSSPSHSNQSQVLFHDAKKGTPRQQQQRFVHCKTQRQPVTSSSELKVVLV